MARAPVYVEDDRYEVTNLEPGDWFWSDHRQCLVFIWETRKLESGVLLSVAKPVSLGVHLRRGIEGRYSASLTRLRPGYEALPKSPWHLERRSLYPQEDYDLSAL